MGSESRRTHSVPARNTRDHRSWATRMMAATGRTVSSLARWGHEVWQSLAGRERVAFGVLVISIATIVSFGSSAGAALQAILWVVFLSSLLVATRNLWTG